jgi:hypothetical protein
VRDCRKAPLPSGVYSKVPTLSVTTTVQLALNTQLTAGALTLTTVRSAACAGSGADSAAAAAMTMAGADFMSPLLTERRPEGVSLYPERLQGKVEAGRQRYACLIVSRVIISSST